MASIIQRTVAAVAGKPQQPNYQTIPQDGESTERTPSPSPSELRAKRSRRGRRIKRGVLGAIVVIAVGLFTYGVILGTAPPGPQSCDTVDTGYECKPSISRFWGQYSPYFSVPSEIPVELPPTCQLTFVQVLSRHGARDPTSKKTVEYADTIEYIQENAKAFHGKYSFLKKYKYSLGGDELSEFGEQQMVNSGIKFYQRYRPLTRDTIPFVRASGQHRVVESAENFTQGFHLARSRDHRGRIDSGWPYTVLVIPEGPEYNNTLDHGRCTSFENGTYSTVGDVAMQTWANIFVPPITARISRKLQLDGLTIDQTLHLMDMCPFDTVAHPLGKVSPFCKLFSNEDWEAFGYYQSLGKFYGFGAGNPLGATQGVGFANELIARLTQTKVNDHTSTNSTLDDNEATFPLGKTLYADFSHDNDMSSAMAALGLWEGVELRPDRLQTPQQSGGYSAAWTVPFGSRIYIEKWTCEDMEGEQVRIVVNDRVVPQPKCSSDAYGLCSLGAFVDGLSYVQRGGDWDKCFDDE